MLIEAGCDITYLDYSISYLFISTFGLRLSNKERTMQKEKKKKEERKKKTNIWRKYQLNLTY